AENLTKRYRNFMALDNLSFTVKQGTCVGYLGPNGSGKSTTIKILTGLSRPTSGKVSIFGYEVGKETRSALQNVGAVVETPVFFPFLTPVDVLSYFGSLRGMTRDEITDSTKNVLETDRLEQWKSQKIGSFSKGMV